MTIHILTEMPSEKGTAVFSVSPVDEAGDALSFAQLINPQWQLMRTDGSIIAGCAFSGSALTGLKWVVKGDQLAMFGEGDTGTRRLTFKATYDSDLGSGLHLHEECKFKIQDLLGII